MKTALSAQTESYTVYLKSHDVAYVARLVLTGKLTDWHMTELLEDAKVVVSELVTNASKLGEVFSLTLRCFPGKRLRIEVEDGSREVPVITYPLADVDTEDPDDNGGRGLVLVQALTDTWGTEPTENGKVVWAELTC